MNKDKLKAYRIFQDEEKDTKIVFHYSETEAKQDFYHLIDNCDCALIYSQRDKDFDKYAIGNKPYHFDQTLERNHQAFYEQGWWIGTQEDTCCNCYNGIYDSIRESQIACSDCSVCFNCAIDQAKDEDCNCGCKDASLRYKDQYIKELESAVILMCGAFEDQNKVISATMKLDPSSKVSRYLFDNIPRFQGITVQHMILHTSRLKVDKQLAGVPLKKLSNRYLKEWKAKNPDKNIGKTWKN